MGEDRLGYQLPGHDALEEEELEPDQGLLARRAAAGGRGILPPDRRLP